MLKFSNSNSKLAALQKLVGGEVWTFSLLSGYTCPFARDCLSYAVRENGKTTIVDGEHTKFRCFSASQEALFPAVYNARKHNTDMIKSCGNNQHKMCEMIIDALPRKATYIRIHVGGDFFTKNYFLAWLDVAMLFPDVTFYAYTKSLPYWVNASVVPSNMILTASRGGIKDDMITQYKLREAVVVFNHDDAKELELEIDDDDSHAALPELKDKSFALLIHGVQPKGSDASVAVNALDGKGSYGKGMK